MDSCNVHRDCIVVYNGKECPFCSMEKDAADNIERRDIEIDRIESELRNLEDQIEP